MSEVESTQDQTESNEPLWQVQLASGQACRMTLELLDDAFQDGLITEDTLIMQDGTTEWVTLRALLGLDSEAEAPASGETNSAAAVGNPAVAVAAAGGAIIAALLYCCCWGLLHPVFVVKCARWAYLRPCKDNLPRAGGWTRSSSPTLLATSAARLLSRAPNVASILMTPVTSPCPCPFPPQGVNACARLLSSEACPRT